MNEMGQIHLTATHLFRHESGKMLAVLVKLFGLSQVEVAEDIVQETLLSAIEHWKLKGIPDDPRAWLYRTAKNKTIDYLRRERNFRERVSPIFTQQYQSSTANGQWLGAFFLEDEVEDAQLRMMFACCHPILPPENQLALMLRTLCGLSAKEIAIAFHIPEDTVAKRIYRAKEKIKEEALKLEVPTGLNLLPRLDAVLQAIYLLFNEGYKSATTDSVIRQNLCEEAIRLAVLLTKNKHSDLPKTHALLSLLCFQAARFPGRMNENGEIVLLQDQDRRLWNRALIALGYQHLTNSSKGDEVSEYHLESAIASYHVSAVSFDKTNWKAILYCYDLLAKLNPSPVVAFNRAIAMGYAEGADKGIEALKKVGNMEQNYLYHTALGDFHAKNYDFPSAKSSYANALKMAILEAEKKVITKKIQELP